MTALAMDVRELSREEVDQVTGGNTNFRRFVDFIKRIGGRIYDNYAYDQNGEILEYLPDVFPTWGSGIASIGSLEGQTNFGGASVIRVYR